MKYYNVLAKTEQQQVLNEDQKEMTGCNLSPFPCAASIDHYFADSCLWHWHDEIEVAYVQEGELTVHINDLQYLLHKGEGVFVNTGVLHSYSAENNIQAVFPNIQFMPSFIYGSKDSVFWTDYVQPLMKSTNLSHIILSENIQWQREILTCIRRAFELLEHTELGYEFTVHSLLSDVIRMICKSNSLVNKNQNHDSTSIGRIRRMLSFIDAHYTEPIQLQQIAESAFISGRECLRLFQNIIGTSPKQYIIQLRLRKAKKMLSETTISIAELCGQCGFQSQSYFTQMFRKQFGTSPAKYRKNSENIGGMDI